MPTVSVIMPAYNVAPYIGAAIESALAQTFRDLEVIVVDDGSTDETATVVSRYVERDPRVRLLQQENGGVSVGRNTALRVARGEFLALLDGDDLWNPEYLDEQLAVFRARPDVSIVTANAFYLGSDLSGQPARPTPDPRPEPTLRNLLEDEECVFIMSIFRRTVYEAIGDFDGSIRSNEDYDYWLRAALAGFRFARNDKPLGHYRRRSDSVSASEVRMLRGVLYVLRKLRPFLTAHPEERDILDRQEHRFEVELLAAEARSALEHSDFDSAAASLDALHAKQPTASVAVARLMAHWAPTLLARAYSLRRTRHALGARLSS
jgi:glycosyltransferase involved in cell wall biosynthesis